MKARPILLPLFLSVTLGAVYFLPSAGSTAESSVRMELPDGFGQWHFKNIPPSEAETGTLASDTEFSKAICLSARPGQYDAEGRLIPDRIDLSIVLSGVDINNSIHRPERCMPAQGHQILSSTDRNLKLATGQAVTAKRLHSIQRIPTNADGTEHLELNCLTYYFFVGHDSITNSHLHRTLIDMKDRLIKGMDQRWAYVSASMWYGELPWMEGVEITEAEADEKLSGFVSKFSERQIDWEQMGQ